MVQLHYRLVQKLVLDGCSEMGQQGGNGKHALVIGAGIIGVNCAYALQEKGFSVTLVDKNAPGTATSRGNAGCFAIADVLPISVPGLAWSVPKMLLDPLGPLSIRWSYLPKLVPWLLRFVKAGTRKNSDRITAEIASLVRGVSRDYNQIISTLGCEHLIKRNGCLFLYESAKHFSEEKVGWEARRRYGIRFEYLTTEELRAMEPDLSPCFKHAIYVPDVFHTVNPQAFVEAIATGVASRGGKVLEDEVTEIDIQNRRAKAAVLASGERIEFDIAVIAGGAWSRKLCRAIGSDIPLDTERGYNTTIPDPGVSLSRPALLMDRSIAITPMEMGLRIGGAVEFGGLHGAPNFERAKTLLRHGLEALPKLKTHGGKEWMGFRPSMPDSKPVISKARLQDNIFLAFGHGHLGLTQGATTGKAIACMAVGEPCDFDVAPFSVERF
ncbi:NAD(P)/FAD-dependent oxidoreductase (plasmid) [Rhizobium leguminosarum]